MGGGGWRNRRTDPDLVPTRLLPESKKRQKHSEIVASTLGSGPRGRRFKSSRPDQKFLTHNHPGGDPSPSLDDVQLTRRLVDAGALLGVDVLDHIIVGDGRYYSFKEAGRL